MTEVDVKIKIINTILKTKLPEYATAGAACMDLRASESCIIEPNETKIVGTNIAIELPEGYKLHVVPRSGLASRGIGILNSPGTIDCDYRGEIKVIIYNASKENFYIEFKLILIKIYKYDFFNFNINLLFNFNNFFLVLV